MNGLKDFLLQLKDLLLAGGRVHDHWQPHNSHLGRSGLYKKSCLHTWGLTGLKLHLHISLTD